MNNKVWFYFFGVFSCGVPALLFLSNASRALGFADAGEFALVTRILSIAHPPGFPSYVFTGWLWGLLASWFSPDHVWNMVLYSVLCAAVSCGLLYLIVVKIFDKATFSSPLVRCVVAMLVAWSYACGATVWYWSHSVEVYAFQMLALGLLLFGLVSYHIERKRVQLLCAAIGLGLGLTNHHLTMILFIPFVGVFFVDDVLYPSVAKNKGKKIKTMTSFWHHIRQKDVYVALSLVVAIVIVFYGLMMWRASAPLPFKFGGPDNFSRLLYHLAGGAWIKNTQEKVEGIVGMRFPYFMRLTFEQTLAVLPFLLTGIVYLWKRHLRLMLLPTVAYYVVVLLYQLRIDQTADTDAYMIFPFYALMLLVPYGILWLTEIYRHAWLIMPFLFGIAVSLNYSRADSRPYDVSHSVMHTLDYSTPPGALVIIADWTTVAQYYYYRIAENFRTDLIVLNYDLKFTHKDILPTLYPDFYQYIKKEYDDFIHLLIKYHPHQAYNTGCTLDNILLSNAFRDLTFKMQEYAQAKGVAYMVDPKTFVFALRDKLMTTQSHVSGMFVSKTYTGLGKEFLALNYRWLSAQRIMRDPAAADKVVDLEAMLDFHRNYYKNLGDENNYQKAQRAYEFIKQLQREMKSYMPFLFRPPGK